MENWLLPSKKVKKKKGKMKFIDLDHAWNDKLLNRLLLSLGCWLIEGFVSTMRVEKLTWLERY